MKFTKAFIILLLINWTASYGQTGSDTLRCYTKTELTKIALKLVKANELDTLLNISIQEIKSQNDILLNQEQIITELHELVYIKDSTILKRDSALELKDKKIQSLNNNVEELQNSNKLLKTGWAVSVAVMIVSLLAIM